LSWQPLCALKTRTNGYFYIPNLAVKTLKVDLLFSDSGFEGDQTGGSSPYTTIDEWPDGKVGLPDLTLINAAYGTTEGESDFNYMADVDADKKVGLSDQTIVSSNYGNSGDFNQIYSTDLTGVTIEFDTGDIGVPNEDGYVSIPPDATYFYVKKNGTPIGALITFYEEELVTYNLTLEVDKTKGYVGDTFTFYGTLTGNGTPVPEATVTLYKNGVSTGLSDTTDVNGNYSISWQSDEIGSFSFYTEAVW